MLTQGNLDNKQEAKMSTVDKGIADRVVAGEWPEDGWVRIVEYDNAWGGVSYGLETQHTLGKYQASPYVGNPRVYWQQEDL